MSTFLSTIECFDPSSEEDFPASNSLCDQIFLSSESILGPHSLLLDTQASIHLISNPELLYSIAASPNHLRVQGITKDTTKVTMQGLLKHINILAYHSPSAAANILSYSKLKETHTCTYDPVCDTFTAAPTLGGPLLTFTNTKGHYSVNIQEVYHVYVAAVEVKQHGFSKRQLIQARKAYDFIHRLGFISYKAASEVVQRSSLSELGFTREDLVNSQYIFGTPAAYQLGHGTTSTATTNTQPLITTDQAQPQELQVDLFFFFGQTFFISISVPMGLIMTTHLGPGMDRATPDAPSAKSKAKAGEALEDHISNYRARGFIISIVTSDGEPAIRAMAKELSDQGVTLNVLGHGTHVPHVESAIRHIKNKARSTAFSLQYTLPSKLAPALITFVVHTSNMIPKTNSINHVPAYTQFTGRLPSFAKQTPHPFGIAGFLQRPRGPSSNTSAQRADYVIWIGTTRNLAGTHRCFNLNTLSEITGDKFTPAPLTSDAIQRLMALSGHLVKPTLALPEDPLQATLPYFPLEPHRGVPDDAPPQPTRSPIESADETDFCPVNELDPANEPDPADDPDLADLAEELDPVNMPSEDAYIDQDHTLIPDEAEPHTDNEPESEQISQPAAVAQELATMSNSSRYNLRRSTTDQHVLATMTIQEATVIYGDKAVQEAGRVELQNCLDKEVWECIPTDARVHKPIPSKLFLTPKMSPGGEFRLLKGRIVGGGHRQDASQFSDSEVSSPTVSLTSVLLGAAIAAHRGYHVMTLDHKAAYLNAEMKGAPVNMMLTPEVSAMLCKMDRKYEAFVRHDRKIAVTLKKALYGCIQSALLWYNELSSTIEEMGFQKNPYDICSYTRTNLTSTCNILVYVDDLLITSSAPSDLAEIASNLKSKYGGVTTTEGRHHDYLGIHWNFTIDGEVSLAMDGYIKDVLKKFPPTRNAKTPALNNLFETSLTSPALPKNKREEYHSAVMTLHYLAKRVRPDILTAVSFCATKVLAPTLEDQSKLDRILGYLQSTSDQKLTLRVGAEVVLRAYVDSSFGTYDDCKSVTGIVIMLGNAPVYFKSSKQKIVTRSSTEAELVGISDALSQILWTREFTMAQGIPLGPAILYQDNKSTIFLAEKGRSTSERTRHIKIRYFFIAHYIASHEIVVEYMPTKLMLADILTKALHGTLFTDMRDAITGNTPTTP